MSTEESFVPGKRTFGFGWLTSPGKTIKRALNFISNKTRKILAPKHGTIETLYSINDTSGPHSRSIIINEYTVTTTAKASFGYKYDVRVTQYLYYLGNFFYSSSYLLEDIGVKDYHDKVKISKATMLNKIKSIDMYGAEIIEKLKRYQELPPVRTQELPYGYRLDMYYNKETKRYSIDLRLNGKSVDIMYFYCDNEAIKDALMRYHRHLNDLNNDINPDITALNLFDRQINRQINKIINEFFKEPKTLYALFFKKSKSHEHNVKPGAMEYVNFLNNFNILPTMPTGNEIVLQQIRRVLEENKIYYYIPYSDLISQRAYLDIGVSVKYDENMETIYNIAPVDKSSNTVIKDDAKKNLLKQYSINIINNNQKGTSPLNVWTRAGSQHNKRAKSAAI